MRSRKSGALAIWIAALAIPACGGRAGEQRPVAMLSSSPLSAAAWSTIRASWSAPDPAQKAALRPMLERFLVRFPKDGLAPLARVALALTLASEGELAAADAELARTAGLPPGSAHDLWTVARAAVLRRKGRPEAALALLRPLVGKTVDPLGQGLFEEELTLVALQTHREYEAISYMDAWLRVTPEDEKPKAAGHVAALVEQLPREVLIGALGAMRGQGAAFGYGIDIERILSERLIRIATTSGDAALARLLLDEGAGAVAVRGDAGSTLGELATSRRGLNVVLGRTIGLLLPTESPALRDESADVLRGVMWALGLPPGIRASGSKGRDDALVEPTPAEGLRLVTRNDAADPERTEGALDELAGDGAAIVVAGLDRETADLALRWGEKHQMPIIALVPPSGDALSGGAGAFGFLLGESQDDVIAALIRAAPELSTVRVAPVVDSSELALYPAEGGRAHGLSLAPRVACEASTNHAGESRFPIARWLEERTRAYLVTGSPSCAGEVLSELTAARAPGLVALSLEAAALRPLAFSMRVVVAKAGVIPEGAPDDPRSPEVERLAATYGPVGWWTALGRDAATLARVALGGLPTTEAVEPRIVEERRKAARDGLGVARTPLWTTEDTGWDRGRRMTRTVYAVAAPSTSSRR